MTKHSMGLGYRAPFYQDLKDGHKDIKWLEIITENYLWDKGSRRQVLEKLRSHYELAFHGVSLSIASPDEIDLRFLNRLREFSDELQPIRISDHLCWSSTGAHHWHDLLPFPYTQENLEFISKKIIKVQDILARPLVLENLSTYVQSLESEMSEYEFLNQLCELSGCQILLDLNNMIVNRINFEIDPVKELEKINLKNVSQIHLAGHIINDFAIDTHSKAPSEECWKLFSRVVKSNQDIPYMIEWDDEIPDLSEIQTLLEKAKGLII